jgi:hypothetical protein
VSASSSSRAGGRLGGFGSLGHLAGRFAGSLWPGAPSIAGEAWARHWLNPGEQALWARQCNQDRRHAIGVARDVGVALGDGDGTGVPRSVIAAALLHDVGKIESGLGTFSRVGATVAAAVLGRLRVAAWGSSASASPASGSSASAASSGAAAVPGAAAGEGGWRERAGRYVTHDARGAALLEAAGSAPFVVTWAREHHQPESTWTLDPALTAVLKAADGD